MFRKNFLTEGPYASAYSLDGALHSDVITLGSDSEFGDIKHGKGELNAKGRYMLITLVLAGSVIKGTWAEFGTEGNFHMGGDVEFVEVGPDLYGMWSMPGTDGQPDSSGTWALVAQ